MEFVGRVWKALTDEQVEGAQVEQGGGRRQLPAPPPHQHHDTTPEAKGQSPAQGSLPHSLRLGVGFSSQSPEGRGPAAQLAHGVEDAFRRPHAATHRRQLGREMTPQQPGGRQQQRDRHPRADQKPPQQPLRLLLGNETGQRQQRRPDEHKGSALDVGVDQPRRQAAEQDPAGPSERLARAGDSRQRGHVHQGKGVVGIVEPADVREPPAHAGEKGCQYGRAATLGREGAIHTTTQAEQRQRVQQRGDGQGVSGAHQRRQVAEQAVRNVADLAEHADRLVEDVRTNCRLAEAALPHPLPGGHIAPTVPRDDVDLVQQAGAKPPRHGQQRRQQAHKQGQEGRERCSAQVCQPQQGKQQGQPPERRADEARRHAGRSCHPQHERPQDEGEDRRQEHLSPAEVPEAQHPEEATADEHRHAAKEQVNDNPVEGRIE